MEKVLKKILVVILILLMINSFLISKVYAATPVEALGDAIGGLFSGLIGSLTYIYRAPAVIAGWVLNRFMLVIAYAEGSSDPDANTSILGFLSVFDILFNKVEILSIDFFDLDNTESLVGQFRVNVAAWFYIMRNVSAGILLVILVYVGIRMAVSTVASDRAMYKKMLADWAVSLCLIFILTYIIMFTVEVNNAIVSALSTVQESDSALASTMSQFGWKGLNYFGGIPSIVAAIIYLLLIWQTATLFFSYFNRMLKIAFLIIIAPLISLTYSIDKMGDGKAQALDAWLKEFVFTILIQPFHCVIYMSLISTSLNVLNGLGAFNKISETLGAGIIAIVCVMFTKEAEKIVRNIFNFQDNNKGTSLVAGAMLASATIKNTANFGKNMAKGAHGVANLVKGTKDLHLMTDMHAVGKYLFNNKEKDENGNVKKDENGNVKTRDFKDIRSEIRENAYKRKLDIIEGKETSRFQKLINKSEKLKKLSGDKKKQVEGQQVEAQVESAKKEISDEKERLTLQGYNGADIEALAKLNVAKRKRSELRKNKAITGFTSKVPIVPKAANKLGESIGNAAYKVETSRVGKAASAIANTVGNSELAKFMVGEVKESAGFFAAATALASTGKVSAMIPAASSANKVVKQMSESRKGNYVKSIKKLLEEHTSVDKKTTFTKIINNSGDYNLSEDSTPDELKKWIDAIKNACNADDGLSETNIKNTIINSNDPSKALGDLLGRYSAKTDQETTFEKAKNGLINYGTEYAISQKVGKASEVSVTSSDLMKGVIGSNSTTTDNSETISPIAIAKRTILAKKGTQQLIDQTDSINGNETGLISGDEDTNPTVEQIQAFKEEADRYSADRAEKIMEINEKIQNGTQVDDYDQKVFKKHQEYERKKTMLVANAIVKLEAENQAAADKLIQETLDDINKLKQENNTNNDLDDLKKKLEDIKTQLDHRANS